LNQSERSTESRDLDGFESVLDGAEKASIPGCNPNIRFTLETEWKLTRKLKETDPEVDFVGNKKKSNNIY